MNQPLQGSYHFYAGYCPLGVQHSPYTCDCWQVFVFNSKKEMNAWLAEHGWKDGKQVAKRIHYHNAFFIAGIDARYFSPGVDELNRLVRLPKQQKKHNGAGTPVLPPENAASPVGHPNVDT